MPYFLRPASPTSSLDFSIDEEIALSSSPGPIRSPTPVSSEFLHEKFAETPLGPDDMDVDDSDYVEPRVHQSPLSEAQKTLSVLRHMITFSKFGLVQFLKVLFTSEDPTIKLWTHQLDEGDNAVLLLESLASFAKSSRSKVNKWVIEHARQVLEHEIAFLTDNSRHRPFQGEAQALHLSPSVVTVRLLNDFSLQSLGEVYGKTVPHLQNILHMILQRPLTEQH
ncbi:hypothetical protein BT96DRAFT_1004650 [Gymnopus androsaceus JB14]|uniref:Uncharacterized protein n=1 Tax=Gymnopus androsaceus JB14 TaxID=1447944 RepID=A0A6A4GQF1_9AGAR|nr:hypothetical protein BT96DRAFT_1004650 [Gymnopus androsaceus JB14]